MLHSQAPAAQGGLAAEQSRSTGLFWPKAWHLCVRRHIRLQARSQSWLCLSFA
jgi:hypothetical protein